MLQPTSGDSESRGEDLINENDNNLILIVMDFKKCYIFLNRIKIYCIFDEDPNEFQKKLDIILLFFKIYNRW